MISLTFCKSLTLDLVPMPHGHDACILSYQTRIVIVLLQVVTRICFKLLSNPRLNPLCTPHIFIKARYYLVVSGLHKLLRLTVTLS